MWIIGHTGPVPDSGHSTAMDLPAGTKKRKKTLYKLYAKKEMAQHLWNTQERGRSTARLKRNKNRPTTFQTNYIPACCGRTIVSFKPLKEIFRAETGLGGMGCKQQANNVMVSFNLELITSLT